MEGKGGTEVTVDGLIHYCLQKSEAYLDYPFGEVPLCVKVCNKIFAEIYPNQEHARVTLKCDPFLADVYRARYPESVVPGYHVPNRQKPYRNTVYVNKEVSDAELLKMIDHSYAEVIKKLPKKQRNKMLDIP